MKIAFFDSGLGGLSVLDEARKRLPREDFIYFADTLNVPYGTKTKQEVKACIEQSVKQIMEEDVKALVIACNTATSIVISELRNRYDIPIVGMEPAVKPAVEMNRLNGKRVLVFATSLTLRETKYNELVSRIDDMSIVDSLPLPGLVAFCEKLQFDANVIGDYFAGVLAPYRLEEYGTIVLGCTHFPFYKKLLQQHVPGHIRIIDGSTGTVNRLIDILSSRSLLDGAGSAEVTFRSSSMSEEYAVKMERALALFAEMQG
ncbi:glutamate racemase [Paenibacillus sp. MBLB4367]|uniref:glutamate racemase n=1 Tax=Paenibacillus sp. MBLB4367 TaxID=3384767 RepID=UPI003907EE5D